MSILRFTQVDGIDGHITRRFERFKRVESVKKLE